MKYKNIYGDPIGNIKFLLNHTRTSFHSNCSFKYTNVQKTSQKVIEASHLALPPRMERLKDIQNKLSLSYDYFRTVDVKYKSFKQYKYVCYGNLFSNSSKRTSLLHVSY